jgi:hypothetical protein
MRITVFWDVTSVWSHRSLQTFRSGRHFTVDAQESVASIQDGGDVFLRNVGNDIPEDRNLHSECRQNIT